MSNAAILYLRLLRKIVRESVWRLGGAEETYLATGFSGDYVALACSGTVLIQKTGAQRETPCGQPREQANQAREQATHHGNRQTKHGNRHK